MSLGTKNRLLRIANLCREHLRQFRSDQGELVEEYIAEMENSSGGEERHTVWSRFADTKRSDAEMLERLDAAFQRWLDGE